MEEKMKKMMNANKIFYIAVGLLFAVSVSAQTTDKELCKENGFTYVDLGLPSHTMWAGKNIGASNVTRNGHYFAWGETQAKKDYSWETYKYTDDKTAKGINKYQYADNPEDKKGLKWYDGKTFVGDNKQQLEADDDPAHAIMGGLWRVPTWEQWDELITNTTQTWVNDFKNSGVSGCIFQSNINKKAIFFPAAGNISGYEASDDGSMGFYWTANSIGKKVTTCTIGGTESACIVCFYEGGNYYEYCERSSGLSVRPVCVIK